MYLPVLQIKLSERRIVIVSTKTCIGISLETDISKKPVPESALITACKSHIPEFSRKDYGFYITCGRHGMVQSGHRLPVPYGSTLRTVSIRIFGIIHRKITYKALLEFLLLHGKFLHHLAFLIPRTVGLEPLDILIRHVFGIKYLICSFVVTRILIFLYRFGKNILRIFRFFGIKYHIFRSSLFHCDPVI